jgi:hypothetical protein
VYITVSQITQIINFHEFFFFFFFFVFEGVGGGELCKDIYT